MSKETITMDPTAAIGPAGHRRRIPPVAYGILVIAVFAGVIGVGMASGSFQTTGRTKAGGERVAPQGESVSEVKGWMSVGDVAAAWNAPLPELLAAFDLPVDTEPSTAIKDLESDRFSVVTLRDWLGSRGTDTP
jgi:hypothetical protein